MTASQLKDLRKKLGLTQAELAEKLQVSVNTIAAWESGLYSRAMDRMIRLAFPAEFESYKPESET